MPLTLVHQDTFDTDTSADYLASPYGDADRSTPGVVRTDGGGTEVTLIPDVTLSGAGVLLLNFRVFAPAGLQTIWLTFGADDTWGGNGAASRLTVSGDPVIGDKTGALQEVTAGGSTTVTAPTFASSLWLLARREGGNLTSEIWTADPRSGGSAAFARTDTDPGGDVGDRVLFYMDNAEHNTTFDEIAVYEGSGDWPSPEPPTPPDPPTPLPPVRPPRTRATKVPHLAFPFRFDPQTGHAAEVEQDSVEDVAACVEALLLTRPGQRDEHPNFGTPDLAFQQQPVRRDELLEQISVWEPRAAVLIEERPDLLDEALVRLRINVSTEG